MGKSRALVGWANQSPLASCPVYDLFPELLAHTEELVAGRMGNDVLRSGSGYFRPRASRRRRTFQRAAGPINDYRIA